MTPEQYHEMPELSSSMVRCFLADGPRMYEARHVLKTVSVEETDDMRIGTAAQAELSGVGSVVKIPAKVLTKNGQRRGKKWDRFVAENPGKTLVKADEWDRINRIVSAVRNHPLAGKLYAAPGEAEKVLTWEDPETGAGCRAMLDWTCTLKSRLWIADLKVSSARTPREWKARAEDHFYHVQQEWYRWGYRENFGRMPLFVFVVVANKPPHVCRMYQFGPEEQFAAREQMRGALEEIVARTASGDWSDPGEFEVTEISLSPWALEVKYGKRHDDNHDAEGIPTNGSRLVDERSHESGDCEVSSEAYDG